MKNPRVITHEPGNVWEFDIPTYVVTNQGLQDGDGLLLKLCRGDRSDDSKPRQEGVFTETLLQVCLEYLQGVNVGELANRDTSIAITAIEDALFRIGKRAEDRKLRDVQGTYHQ